MYCRILFKILLILNHEFIMLLQIIFDTVLQTTFVTWIPFCDILAQFNLEMTSYYHGKLLFGCNSSLIYPV